MSLNKNGSYRSVLEVLAPNTILGRYLLTAVILVVATVTAARLAQTQVSKTSDANISGQSDRIVVAHTVRQMTNLLWQTETHFQSYMLVPEERARIAIISDLDSIDQAQKKLQIDPWLVKQGELLKESEHLKPKIQQLRQEIEAVMAIRADPIKLFPNMSIMVNDLLPTHNEFIGAATNAIFEVADKDSLSRTEQRVINLFNNVRYTWAQKINTFRIFISTRVGVFSVSVDNGLKASMANIALFDDQIHEDLDALAIHDRQGDLTFEQSLALSDMIKLLKRWNKAYDRVKEIILDDDKWRLDTPIVRNKINPLFIELWKTLQQITAALEQRAADDIRATTKTADQVTHYLWLLTHAVIAVAILGTAIFEIQIRRPISRVIRALKAEADGEQNVMLPRSTIAEANDLTTAFSQMREQIHSRQQEVQSREQRLRSILDNTAEGIITFDHLCIVETWNRAAEHLFGWRESEAIGTHLKQYISFEMQENASGSPISNREFDITAYIGQETEVTGKHRSGSNFPLSLKISRMHVDGMLKHTAVLDNITERKAMLENLRYMAEHDDLTNLHNRAYFHTALNHVVEQVAKMASPTAALLYIDLDNFKYVNDVMGHAAGDKLLVDVSRILNLRARRSDLVARLGGDEFVVIISAATSSNVLAIAESYRRHLSEYSFTFEGRTATLGCSIGIALIGIDCHSPSEILSQADIACHLAKRGGRNRVHLFTTSDAKDVHTMSLDMGWSGRIKRALEYDKFVLALQPIVATRSKLATTFEVLVRMRDEDGSIIMPGGFLPTAERFGMSSDIDAWVIRHAIIQLAAIRKSGHNLRFSINLSGQSFSVPSIGELISRVIHDTGIDPGAITFEITETVAIADMKMAAALLDRLRTLGCRTSLDDFGSGMSSFAYLRELPVDVVKIDGRFVKNVADNPVDLAMLKAMNDIAHALGKETVAEFVEDESHFNLICELGVDYGQGYHLGKPALIDTWIAQWAEDAKSNVKKAAP